MNLVHVNGIDLASETHGPATGKNLVLIRGLGTQMVEWEPTLIDGLVAMGFHVVVFDNRDVGLSTKFDDVGPLPDLGKVARGEATPPYTIHDMAQDTVALLDELKLPSAHVLGISMGGMIAQVLAASYPERVDSLISVMSSSGAPGLPAPSSAALSAMNDAPASDATDEQRIRASADSRQVFGSPGFPEDEATRLARARLAYERCYCPAGIVRQRAAILVMADRSHMLKTITIPTTVIHGIDDPLLPLAHGLDTAKKIPGAKMVEIPGMGHNIPAALVGQFLNRVQEHFDRLNDTVKNT